ncbi:hypothetical protein [Streptococcus gordonii]|jgi:hypothetical protein|uniref:hypothetical protein n=1 Tax=Streptococcus gordonii TaxID=1302 RepID=UPI000FA3BD2B|nr:hypothetical protein D8809_00855 [Streptococcus gordonii]
MGTLSATLGGKEYLVLNHSSKTYQEICQYLKNGQVELIELENMIVHTYQIPEHGAKLSRKMPALYPNTYLQHFTLLKGDFYETLA